METRPAATTRSAARPPRALSATPWTSSPANWSDLQRPRQTERSGVMADITIPAFIRGRTVRENLVRFDGRGASPSFLAPDPELLLADLPLRDPGALGELHALAF